MHKPAAQPVAILPSEALDAIDELEASARGDEPFNHFAGKLLRAFVEAQAAAPAPAAAQPVAWPASGGDAAYWAHEADRRAELLDEIVLTFGVNRLPPDVRERYDEFCERERLTQGPHRAVDLAQTAAQPVADGSHLFTLIVTGPKHSQYSFTAEGRCSRQQAEAALTVLERTAHAAPAPVAQDSAELLALLERWMDAWINETSTREEVLDILSSDTRAALARRLA